VSRKRLFKFLRKHSLLETDGNVFYAERAFKINSIFNWLTLNGSKLSRRRITSILSDYINNRVDIHIKNGKLNITKLKREDIHEEITPV